MGEVNKQESNVGHKFEPDDVVFIKQDVLRGIWGELTKPPIHTVDTVILKKEGATYFISRRHDELGEDELVAATPNGVSEYFSAVFKQFGEGCRMMEKQLQECVQKHSLGP